MHPMLNTAVKAARKAGSMILRAAEDIDQLTVKNKSANDFVSEVDLASEEIIIDTLKA
ncbi:MAG: inositol monophosphatase family protein, partial [Methylophilaceae bacterium]